MFSIIVAVLFAISIPWVFSCFQTHSDRCRFGAETVRGGLGGRADTGRERAKFLKCPGMQGGLKICGCGREWTKNVNPRRTL